MFRLKLVIEPASAATFNVKVAATIAFAANTLPSLFQVKVKIELADSGFQAEVAMDRDSEVLPVFFM